MFACAEVPELLRVRAPGKDPAHPLGTSPERQMSPPGLPVLGCSAGHACCPWTMPLCGRPEPSASAWVTSAAASCLSAPALTGVSKHDCASIGMAHHGTHGSPRPCPQCTQPPLRFPRASLSWPHSSPAPRPLIVLCPLPGVPCPPPGNSALPCVGNRAGKASGVQHT